MTIATIANSEAGSSVRTKLNLAIAAINAGVSLNLKTDFGAAGDGTTNDTTAFNAFRTYALTQNPRWVTLTIPPGDYRCVHGAWMKGIQNLVVYAYGATFTNIGVTGAPDDQGYQYWSDTYALAFGGAAWQDTTDPLDGFAESVYPPVTGVATQTYLINTVAAGSTTVTTTTAGHAGNFSVGDDVMAYGYNQQYGSDSYPPNPKYFEYKKVVTAVAGTGVITLSSPLENRYRSDWTDATWYLVPCGASRIFRLTRTNYQYCQNIVLYGAKFLPYSGWTNASNGSINPSGAKNITLVDVTATGCAVQDAENFHALRCNFVPSGGNGINESDKGCDRAVYEECVIHDHAQGSGVNQVKFIDCTLTGLFQARPRHLVLNGNKISTIYGSGASMVMGHLGGFSSRLISAQDNRFVITNTGVTGIFADAYDVSFVVNTVPSATEFTVVKATYPDLMPIIDQGSRIHTYNVASYATGVVTDFYEDATLLHVVGRWNRTIVAGDTLRMFGSQRLYERGNEIVNKPDGSTRVTSIFRPFTFISGASGGMTGGSVRTSRYFDANETIERITRPTIIKTLGYYQENIDGFITKITVHVQRAYTGPDATCELAISHEGATNRHYGTVDCKTVGMREWNIVGYSTPLGADSSTATINGTYCDATQMFLSSTSSNGTSEQLPLVTVWVEANRAI